MTGKIEPRYGAEVFVSQTGNVCIQQDQPGQDGITVVLHYEEVPRLIELLKQASNQAKDFNPNEEDDEADE